MLVLVPLLTFGFALLPYVTLATSLADCTRGPETLADCIPGRLPVHSTVEGQFSLHAGAFSVALKHVPESNHYVPVLSQFRPPLQFELKDGNLTSKGREAYWDPKDPAIFPPLPFRLLFGKPSHPDWASPFVATKCSENGKDVGFLEPLSARKFSTPVYAVKFCRHAIRAGLTLF